MKDGMKYKDDRQLLIEYDAGHISPDENKKIISEIKDMDFQQDFILYAVLQKFGVPNKNGRIYPESVLKREIEKYQLIIKNGGALNELNHPTSSLIDLDRISHSILDTWWEGNVLLGRVKLFTSPGWKKSGIISCKGDQAAMLLMNGATLGISSRGIGSLKNEKGLNIVQDDFELVSFDLVSSPSTPGAYVFRDLDDIVKFEINDPQDQLNRFLEQQKLRESGDEEAQMLDIDFVEMLEYGMPLVSGYGQSERIFWFLENITAREGTLFPQMKPELEQSTKKIYKDILPKVKKK